jgi:hypothetical protein
LLCGLLGSTVVIVDGTDAIANDVSKAPARSRSFSGMYAVACAAPRIVARRSDHASAGRHPASPAVTLAVSRCHRSLLAVCDRALLA